MKDQTNTTARLQKIRLLAEQTIHQALTARVAILVIADKIANRFFLQVAMIYTTISPFIHYFPKYFVF